MMMFCLWSLLLPIAAVGLVFAGLLAIAYDLGLIRDEEDEA